MDIFKMTDKELVDFATPILSKLIDAGNAKDWEKFSEGFNKRGKEAGAREDVENQWQNNPPLCHFKQDFESMGIIRKSDHVATIWKMHNELTTDEILGILCFEHEDDDVSIMAYRVF